MKSLTIAAQRKIRWFVFPTLVLVFGVGCSSGIENQPRTTVRAKREPNKPRFRSPEMDAMYQAAKAAPRSFDPVYAYSKAVADACLASLAFPCETCGEGAMRYKKRSELDAQYWPIIDEALSMLDVLGKSAALTAPDRVELLISTKGRLLWLAGRSVEEHTMIEEYVKDHPAAASAVRRRLELLRESNDLAGFEAQCSLSRRKVGAAPEAGKVDLLTACVALHPRNTHGRSDLLDYSRYLPNLTPAEENLYRGNLVERCEVKAGDEEASCAEGCACDDPSNLARKCKKTCARCRSESAQRSRLCQKITEAPTAVVRTPKPSPAAAHRAPQPRSARADDAPRPKVDTGKGLKPIEL
jgi:hypothetical protein